MVNRAFLWPAPPVAQCGQNPLQNSGENPLKSLLQPFLQFAKLKAARAYGRIATFTFNK
jgi:hypothetical protein